MERIDNLYTREHLSFLRRAAKERWPVSEEQKAKTAEVLAQIIENAEGKYSTKDVLTATRVQLEMDNANIKNALAVESAELAREKFEKISSLENLIQHSLADGPPSGPIVSDTPLPALEFIDVQAEDTQDGQPPEYTV